MNRIFSSMISLALLALLAAPLLAQEDAAKKKADRAAKKRGAQGAVISGQLAEQLEKVTLTEEQKKQLEDIKAKYADKVREARRAVNNALPRDVRQARNAARTKAREEGKTGAELQAAVDAAVTLTDEQKKALADAEAQMREVQTEIRQAVLAILTDEQKQAAGLNQRKKKKAAS